MSDRKGVIRVNVSVPRELKSRMDAEQESVNWSSVATQAFEAKLREIASRKGTTNMNEVIERLKAAKELEANKEYQDGFRYGQRWARNDATPKLLERATGFMNHHWGNDWWNIDRSEMEFAAAILNVDSSDDQELFEFWDNALKGSLRRVYDCDFLRGFGDGVADLWEKVADKI